jgi:prophage DNA circulation protein
MTWFDDLRRVTFPDGRKMIGASFRGVPFLVEEAQRSGGRRVVVHEFPLRNDPFTEDMGRRARKFSVTGYVIGNDYMVQRDTLLTALEDFEGPGQLIHPYYGTQTAICDTYNVVEKVSEGGMATFTIAFDPAPTQTPVPTIEVDAASTVSASADAAITATQAEFTAQYNPAGLPSFALASAATALSNAAAGLRAKLAPAVSATQELASLDGQLRTLTSQAAALVRQPANVLGAFRGAITGLVTTALTAPGDVMNALLVAYGTDLGPPAPTTTATRQREAVNQLALTGALQRIIVIEAARLAPLVPYASIDEATAARDQIAGLLDDQAQTAGDTAYPALVDLRSSVLRAVPGATAFARVVTVTRRVSIPSLVLAYQLYGSVDQEPDILARNKIRHPGFLVGDLKVLSDD